MGGKADFGLFKAEQINSGYRHVLQRRVPPLLYRIAELTNFPLFGPESIAVDRGMCYNGSTHHVFDRSIQDHQFYQHIPLIGDIDVIVDSRYFDKLVEFMETNKKIDRDRILGTKKHGTTLSVLIQMQFGKRIQFDFESGAYDGYFPSAGARFVHSSSFEDRKLGIKGAHHKIMINAIAKELGYKFSPIRGLKKDDAPSSDEGLKDPDRISEMLFGDEYEIKSFKDLIYRTIMHVDPLTHEDIYNRFVENCVRSNCSNDAAIGYATRYLKPFYVAFVPMAGFYPHSHLGHVMDLGGAMHRLHPDLAMIAISNGAKDLPQPLRPQERIDIAYSQFGQDILFVSAGGLGQVVEHIWDNVPAEANVFATIVTGHDQQDFAERVYDALSTKSVDHPFTHITKYSTDKRADPNKSGTRLRETIAADDWEAYRKLIGPGLPEHRVKPMFARLKRANLPIKRR